MLCQNCKQKLNKSDYFCPSCGQKNAKSKNVKKYVFIAFIFVLIISCVLIFIVLKTKSKLEYNTVISTVSYNYDDESLTFVDGKFSDKTVKSSEEALEALGDLKDKIGFKNVKEEFKQLREDSDNFSNYYRFSQIYKDVIVYNSEIIIATDKNGLVTSFSGHYEQIENISVTPKISKDDIAKIVMTYLSDETKIEDSVLCIFNYDSVNYLAYKIIGITKDKATELIIDANNGEIIHENNLFSYSENYPYTGEGLDGKVFTINLEKYLDPFQYHYKFYDKERKIAINDYRSIDSITSVLISLIPGDFTYVVDIKDNKIYTPFVNTQFVQSAISAMGNFAKIYDYYASVLNRNSYDNKGGKISVNIGIADKLFSKDYFNNAAWARDINQMYIGGTNGKSYSASLDVLAHEFTHGVVNYTANFANLSKNTNAANENGALNEAYADIIGSLIEGKNWTIAEDNETIRDLANPNIYQDPGVKGGKYYFPDGYNQSEIDAMLAKVDGENIEDYDNGGVHKNSTVVSHAAYLMEKNGAFKDKNEMAKVWYNSLFLLSPYSNFSDSANAVLESAKKIGLNDASINKITKAFQDTNILENKNHILKGIITSNDHKIKDVTVKVKSYNDNSLIEEIVNNSDGSFEFELPPGMYVIEFSKDNYQYASKIINLISDTTMNVVIEKNVKNFDKINLCHTDNCYNLTYYYLTNTDGNLDETSVTYSVDSGTVLDANKVVQMLNEKMNSNILTTDQKSFYLKIGEFETEFAWYYKDTDEVYDWSVPITSDTEIEMRLFNGLIDNAFMKDLYDYFN